MNLWCDRYTGSVKMYDLMEEPVQREDTGDAIVMLDCLLYVYTC